MGAPCCSPRCLLCNIGGFRMPAHMQTRATVTKWLKAEGDEVNEYDAVLELSTDSLYAPGDAPDEGAAVDMVVELTEYGFVGKLFVDEGDTVEVRYRWRRCNIGRVGTVDESTSIKQCNRCLFQF